MAKTKIILLLLTSLALAGSANAAIVNGGFETPAITGTYQSFNAGDSSITGWTILTNTVTILTNSYQEGALQFDSHSGNQHLDLTGEGNTGVRSVEQTVDTMLNTSYVLSFWVANQDDSFFYYPLPSTVNLYLNGSLVNAYTNTDSTPGNLNWKEFQYVFTANSESTTIRFENATPIGDNMLGLDDVSLELDASAVPEPGSMALIGLGMAALAAFRRR